MANGKLATIAGAIVLAATVILGFLTRTTWMPMLEREVPSSADDDHHHAQPDRVRLSPQARDNLKLVVKPLTLQSYWRTMQVPGSIVDRPGVSDRGISSPVAGVVSKIFAYPGDTVRPGDRLFAIRLISEYLQNSQTELFKATQEVKLNQAQLARARNLVQSGTLEEAKVIELQNQERRLQVQIQALRQDLMTRGLSPEQINSAADGKFVSEVVVAAPPPAVNSPHLVDAPSKSALVSDFAYEVQELKVQLGEQVQGGQILGILANHRLLYIEGRAFKKEATLLERAAQNNWPVEAEFTEDDPGDWPALDQKLLIRHLANQIDPASRTFGFFIPLQNQSRTLEKDSQIHLVWRFRPGQRVRLHVPVEEFKDVFVVPVAAVAREGLEAYIFRQNGNNFDRKPVRIIFEDRRHVILANDGQLLVGSSVAQSAAAALNRALKAQQAGDAGHEHDHAGHSH